MNACIGKIKTVCLLFVLLSVNFIGAKVNPRPGENLWRLASRIGFCADKVDSKIDNLRSIIDTGFTTLCSKIEKVDEDLETHNEIVCSKIDELNFAGTCETLIFQSDIPFTIDKAGVYCLAESVTFDTGTAITIAANNVLLDLNKKKIDGSGGGSIGVAINSGLQNISIQNGTLCNMDDKGIDADATNNIAFVSMSVSDSLIDSIVDMPVAIAPITCLQIKDVKVLNVGMFKEFPIISVVDSIVDSIIDTPDCILSPVTGINVNCVVELVLDNCHVFSCLGDGFALQQTEHSLAQSCQALRNGGNGFVLNNADTTKFKWCQATMNCFNGFCDSACNGDNLYNGCVAKQNGVHGFNIAGGGKSLQKCVASQNTGNGFNLSTSLVNDGQLDTTFGNNGIVITDISGFDAGNTGAVQKDNKLVLAGASTVGGNLDFAIARYNENGSLDTSFGTDGFVTTSFGGTVAEARGIVIQQDGKIVVAGFSNLDMGVTNDFVVARYTIDGSLDLTFGNGGKVRTGFVVGSNDVGTSVALQKDGKIVVAGLSDIFGDFNFALVRYNSDGSLDTTFGQDGKVVDNLGGSEGFAVEVQKDGKIVVVGRTSGGTSSVVVARYNQDGSLDGTFNPAGPVQGVVIANFGSSDQGLAVALQKDGKIVAAGESDNDFLVVRYNINGSLDTSFGTNGFVITDLLVGTADEAKAVTIQKDGKIVAVGTANVSGSDNFAVVRYNPDGSLDVSFNPAGSLPGTVVTDLSGNDNGNEVAIQHDGKLVVFGGSSGDFALVQYAVFKRGVAVSNCLAEENGGGGFNITGNAYVVCDSAAIHNARNGFVLELLTNDCQLLNNKSVENGRDGFLLESLTDSCQLLSNQALKNNNIGLANLGTNQQIFNNRSHNNMSSNYFGVPLVTIPILTTGFWANVEV